jgi:hypothetical protein
MLHVTAGKDRIGGCADARIISRRPWLHVHGLVARPRRRWLSVYQGEHQSDQPYNESASLYVTSLSVLTAL